jgi:hypothetical protein
MNGIFLYRWFLLLPFTFLFCNSTEIVQNIISRPFIYTITEHNDSLYCSTRFGEIFRFSPNQPDSITSLGLPHFFPIRSLAFKKNGDLWASSYETGTYQVLADTLVALPKIWRKAWSMILDRNNNAWFAGRRGVFRQCGDSLQRFSSLHEAYDIDFFNEKLVVAHSRGITFYDTISEKADTTFCNGVICWSVDIEDTLCIGTGVETCIIITPDHSTSTIRVPPKNNIPWSVTTTRSGTMYLATQKGLYCIEPGATVAHCIGFKNKCIKAVYVDKRDRLWIGTYYNNRPN